MPDFTVKIDPNDPLLSEAFQRAFINSFSAEAKDKLIQSAMSHLFQRSDNYYGEKVTPLTRSVLHAADSVALQHVKEMMSDPNGQFAIKIKEAVSNIALRLAESFASDAFEKILSQMLKKLAEKIEGPY